MHKLNEREIASNYIGKPFSREKLLAVSHQNGTSYPENHPRFIATCHHYKQDLLELFGITDRLFESWGYYGIEFSVYIYTDCGKITGCKIFKYKDRSYWIGHGRPSGCELIPSQQEIRIFRRIMDYIII